MCKILRNFATIGILGFWFLPMLFLLLDSFLYLTTGHMPLLAYSGLKEDDRFLSTIGYTILSIIPYGMLLFIIND